VVELFITEEYSGNQPSKQIDLRRRNAANAAIRGERGENSHEKYMYFAASVAYRRVRRVPNTPVTHQNLPIHYLILTFNFTGSGNAYLYPLTKHLFLFIKGTDFEVISGSIRSFF
jgi:hypothetical protein